MIPGTPNISTGMEQFNDTPLVNGVAYPTITLQPKSYRFRVLNAANDRFMNYQWYVGDPTTASTGLNTLGDVIGATEVALNPAELLAAQTDPVIFPTPVDAYNNAAGPDWIQIGTEGGFLPAPVVVDGQQPTTWITDPTRFDVGLVDKHSLLLAPAERADVIVDFSQFAGKTLILYNDAPGRVPCPGAVVRLLHRRSGPEPERRPRDPARVRAEHPHYHAGQDRGCRPGARLQPDGAAQRLQPQGRRERRLRVRTAPDHRRAGGLQLGLRHELRRRQQLQHTPEQHDDHRLALRRPCAHQRHLAPRL